MNGNDISFVPDEPDCASMLARPSSVAQSVLDGRYRCLFENNVDAVFALDCDGHLTEANPATERLIGYSKTELREMGFAELCALEDRHKAMLFFARAFSRTPRTIELSAICRDGSCVDLCVSGAPIMADGEMVGLFCSARDITRSSRAKAQLRMAQKEAEQAKDRFLSVLSHELRTPLMPVLVTVQMLEQQPGLPAELSETLGMMRRNLELEARLIDDLLDLNRIRQGKLTLSFQSVDVHAKVQHVLDLCGPQITEKKIEVQLDLQASAKYLAADAARLDQVLWNIVGNAVKFTPAGGKIKIVTCNGAENVAECSSDCGAGKPMCKGGTASRSRPFMAIHVSDSGVGITPESMRRLFSAFESAPSDNENGSVLGMSLTISKALVELHGGRLIVHSDGTNLGATFSVILPVRRLPQPKCRRSQQMLHGSAQAASRKVLLVEDHVDTAKALSRLLSLSGFKVEIADTVHAAQELAATNHFDLLISDIGLPDGSGLDVVRHVKGRYEIPAIALSGYGMEDDIKRSLEAGFAEHLVKPINIAKLHEVIETLMYA